MPIVVNVIQKSIIPNCRTISMLVKTFGNTFSVRRVQIGKEIPERKKVSKTFFKLKLMVSTKSAFIPKIATPAEPTKSAGNKYLSKLKLIAVKIVAMNIAIETITMTNVSPSFCFNGFSMLTNGTPSPKSIGMNIIQLVK